MEEEHANNVMATLVHPTEMHQRVDTGCEGAVEPPSSLANEFWCTLRDISLSFGRLHIG